MFFPIYDKNKNIKCYTQIDKDDLEKMRPYSWSLMGRGYIKTHINKKNVYLHRFLMDEWDPKIIIDHINKDPLDNRKKNLRRATLRQNSFNRTKCQNSSSEYKGVSYNKVSQKWESYVKIYGVKYTLGFFIKEKEAAKAYNCVAKELYGEYCHLNKLR